jgi:hypothetical protein
VEPGGASRVLTGILIGSDRSLCLNSRLTCLHIKKFQDSLGIDVSAANVRPCLPHAGFSEQRHRRHRLELRCLRRSTAMANVNANAAVPPQPRRSSQTSHTSDEWHSAPSIPESSADAPPPSTSTAAPLVDLNPGVSHSENQQPSQPAGGPDAAVVPEKKKCWICLVEEGESLPNGTPANSSRWAKACACSLDAHESCLITWINQTRGADTSTPVTSLSLSLSLSLSPHSLNPVTIGVIPLTC